MTTTTRGRLEALLVAWAGALGFTGDVFPAFGLLADHLWLLASAGTAVGYWFGFILLDADRDRPDRWIDVTRAAVAPMSVLGVVTAGVVLFGASWDLRPFASAGVAVSFGVVAAAAYWSFDRWLSGLRSERERALAAEVAALKERNRQISLAARRQERDLMRRVRALEHGQVKAAEQIADLQPQRVPTSAPHLPTAPFPTSPAFSPLPTIGRNDPCFCGSGKKYKRCHGASQPAQIS